MKIITLTTLFSLYALFSVAQTSEWIWVNGDTTLNVAGSYGVRSVSSPDNQPHSRYAATSWKDNNGDLWLFGGNNWANDLWKYNIATNEWVWTNGDTTNYSNGQYGAQGVPATGNRPTGRFSAAGWTGKDGKLWLFGGYAFPAVGGNYGYMNDLWSYDVPTNQWTWVSGDTTIDNYGIYGALGVASPTNKPGGRRDAAQWIDKQGNLWLFGGYGMPGTGSTITLNDLWKYDITTSQWTWVKGDSSNSPNNIYGTQGVPGPTNKPGSRQVTGNWVDTSGDLWLFGGLFGYRNDLWRYNIASNQWTWVSGDNFTTPPAVYGAQGTPNAANKPGGRQSLVSWTDSKNNLWLFGGEGKNISGTYVWFNELWKYNIATTEWTWVKGSTSGNNNGIYGTQGVGDPNNTPGSRIASTGWVDNSGSLWLFGGYGYPASGSPGLSNSMNDFWKFDIAIPVQLPTAQFSAAPDTICADETISFTDQSLNALSWRWEFQGGTPDTSTKRNPTIVYHTAGTYNVKLIAANNSGTDSLTKAAVIKVNALPQPVTTATDTLICAGDSTEVCVTGSYANYVWNTGSTSQCIWATQAGGVWPTVTDTNGCSAVASHINIEVYPVPSVSITVQGDTLASFGAVAYQWYFNDSAINGATTAIYVVNQSGNYSVQITDANGCKARSSNTAIFITGINENKNSEPVIYPNPLSVGNWRLAVDNSLIGNKYEVYDAIGKLAFQSTISNLKSEIEFDAAPGMYYLKIITGNGTFIRPLVKQ